ncbi:ubinuclein-1-like isoform X3 [Camellia sinensis]|uniref:ubinuclein-1-like isoform X3 n=1 Tax=Camellia sinensis TaxID=4442 RepID=UPI0010359F44|nr:ubinuclein-1-like isoform X3 [Camellia sinensis]
MQKAPVMQIKEGLNVRPKCTMLEKAIRELEKMVAESRPPTMEVQDADISSQAVKRRLPHEVKQKLAKVARLAQANHGKISMELVNRLMSIVGRMVQLRTLEIEQGILDLLALDSISGGGHANVNLFPNVDSSWKVCMLIHGGKTRL